MNNNSFSFATGIYGELGKDYDLPWGKPLKYDMDHYKTFCYNKTLVMGLKTYRSLPSSVRTKYSIILLVEDRDDGFTPNYQYSNTMLISYKDLDKVLHELVISKQNLCFIGGKSILEWCLRNTHYFDMVLHTDIYETFHDATVYIDPELIVNLVKFKNIACFEYESDGYNYEVCLYDRGEAQ